MTVQMNSAFRGKSLSKDKLDKIATLQNEECKALITEVLKQDLNMTDRASRAVILGTAQGVFEQNFHDLETMFDVCKDCKAFQPAFRAATLVLFGAKDVKSASGKSTQNTYYVDPSNYADLSNVKGIMETMDQADLEKRFSQFFGSVAKSDKGLRIKPYVCNAKGTLTNFANAYKVAFVTGSAKTEATDIDKLVKDLKSFFKKADLTTAELENLLNQALKNTKLKVMQA